jgi:CIC family chloride channel protein
MDQALLRLPDTMSFDQFVSEPNYAGGLRHIVLTNAGRITGVLRINTAFRRGLKGTFGDVRLRDLATRDFTIARRDDVMFNVIARMWRRNATMAVVVDGPRMPRAANVIGVISKEHVADSVAESIRSYGASGAPE